MKVMFHFGALSEPISEQMRRDAGVRFKDPVDAAHIQKDADAITRLAVRGLLPDREVHKARQRLVKAIEKTPQKKLEE